ncbi:MAG: sel1 repeat family protein [Deltaproteobacteria bacterium]|nr:sel1 repeat family protein [Deltaproteobacteria bacterium]
MSCRSILAFGACLGLSACAAAPAPQPGNALPRCSKTQHAQEERDAIDTWPVPLNVDGLIAEVATLPLAGRRVARLHVEVNAQGTPVCARVEGASGDLRFDQRVEQSAWLLRFTPASTGERPTAAWLHLSVPSYDDGDAAACRDGLRFACAAGGRAAWAKDQLDEAEWMLQRACELGDAGTCAEFGRFLRIRRNQPERGATFVRYGCERGSPGACRHLGYLHERGLGVRADWVKAAALYLQGCLGKDGEGCYLLGLLYWRGVGVVKDRERAVALIDEGCALGVTNACTALGWRLVEGDGIASDVPRGRRLLERACRQGDGGACDSIAGDQEEQDGVLAALPMIRRVCDLEPMRCDLARLEAQRKLPGDTPAGHFGRGPATLSIRRQLCERQVPDEIACQFASEQLRCGYGVAADLPLAEALAGRACGEHAHRPEACREQAEAMLARGHRLEGLNLLKHACDGSSASACARLAEEVRAEDPARAAVLDAQACDEGDLLGCTHLAQGLVAAAPRSQAARARAIATAACERGAGAACELAAPLLDSDTDPLAQARAAAALRRACDDDIASACRVLAGRYRSGRGVGVSVEKAAALEARADAMPKRDGCMIPLPSRAPAPP